MAKFLLRVENPDQYFFYVKDSDKHFKRGWYFADETSTPVGPFDTMHDAYEGFALHCKGLDEPSRQS